MLKKVLIGIALVVVVLIVAAVVAIKVILTPERIRETVIPLVEKQIHRKMVFGDISIGIFSGISVADMKILDQNGTDEFVSVRAMDLHYRFLPLLSKKIEISEIVLDQPKISVIRLEDGSFNFSDILSPKAKKQTKQTDETAAPESAPSGKPASEPPTAEKPTSGKSGSAMALTVDDIRITDGELLYQDLFVNKGIPLNYVLNRFNLKTSNFSLEKSFPFDLSALVNGAKFTLSGHSDVKNGEGDLTLELDALDIMPFTPYFAESVPGKLGSAKVSTKLDAKIRSGTMTSKGRLTVDNIHLVLNELPEAPIENAALGFDYDISMDSEKKRVTVSSVNLTLNGVGASGKGSVDLAPKTPVLDFTLVLDQLDLTELMQKAPTGLVKDYHDYSLQGKISGEIILSGPVDTGAGLVKSAALDLNQVRASVNRKPVGANGKLSYASGKLKTEGIDFSYADQHGKLTLDMAYLAGKKSLMSGNFAVTADKLDLNTLISESDGTSGAASASKTASPPAQKPQANAATAQKPKAASTVEIGPLDLPLDIRGTLSVKEMLYKKLPITGSEAVLTLKNNLLTLEKLTGHTAGGTLNASAKANLAVKGLAYDGKVDLGKTDVPQIIAGLFPEVKLHIEGKALANATFSGKGTLPENLLPALQLSGKASILDGLVKETEIQNAIALFLGINELKIVSFESLTSDFSLKNKIMNQNSFLDSSGLQVKSNGTISLDGPLNLVLNTRFSPELMGKIKGPQADLTKYLADKDGWGSFSLTVKGTMDKPKIGLDTAGIQKQAEEAVKEKLKEKISEKISDKLPGGSDSTGDAKKDALKQLLHLPSKH